jgi:hypothetical protein
MLSMTTRMSASCSSVDLAFGGGGVVMVATEVGRGGEEQRWWGLVVGCAAPVVEN